MNPSLRRAQLCLQSRNSLFVNSAFLSLPADQDLLGAPKSVLRGLQSSQTGADSKRSEPPLTRVPSCRPAGQTPADSQTPADWDSRLSSLCVGLSHQHLCWREEREEEESTPEHIRNLRSCFGRRVAYRPRFFQSKKKNAHFPHSCSLLCEYTTFHLSISPRKGM